MRPQTPANRQAVRHRTILPRFRDAFSGVLLAYGEEPNLRFHFFAATCVGLSGYAVRLDGWEIAYLAITATAVMLAEMFNTAVERAVDLAADGRRHPLAAQAKEIAAGGVLLAAIHAAFAASLIFLIRRTFGSTAEAILTLLTSKPWLAVLPLGAGLLALIGGAAYERSGAD